MNDDEWQDGAGTAPTNGTTDERRSGAPHRMVDPTPDGVSAVATTALVHAAEADREPVLVIAGPPDRLRIVWANRSFVDAVSAEVSDLDELPLTAVLRATTGELPLNDHRVVEAGVTLTPRVGPMTAWDAVAVPSVGARGRAWAVTLRRSGDVVDTDRRLRASEQRFRALSERAPIGIFSTEVGLRFGYVNDWLAALVGHASERLLGTGWMDVVLPADLDAVCSAMQLALGGQPVEVPVRLTTASADERWVTLRAVPCHAPDSPAAILGTVEDVTDRRRFEQLLSWQATHDPLTGLPNRARLVETIDVALSDALASDVDDVAVLFVDLDDFKLVNDTLGHSAGDELLSIVADRLRAAVRTPDEVFRFAGDEFVVVVRGATCPEVGHAIAERLRAAVSAPVEVAGRTMSVACSVGLVLAGVGASPHDLIRDADIAMYAAKRDGKGLTAIFDPADGEGHPMPYLVGERSS